MREIVLVEGAKEETGITRGADSEDDITVQRVSMLCWGLRGSSRWLET